MEGKLAFTFFFRDYQTMEMIRDMALPSLKTRKYIRIWDAGCAHGPEPYTLAIVLRENMGYFQFRNVTIHATDIDGSNLFADTIAQGIYQNEEVKRIPQDIFAKYFNPIAGNGSYRVVDEIRKSVTFQKHDLLSLKPVREGFGLILCKNVLLHFKEEERIEVLTMFHRVLDTGGFLATEHTQKMPGKLHGLFEQAAPNAQLWKKVGTAR